MKEFVSKLKDLIEKKANESLENKTDEIMSKLVNELKGAYTSPQIASHYESIRSNQKFAELELAPPTEIAANIYAKDTSIIIDLRNDKINRTFRVLELYGNSPYKDFKTKLVTLGFIRVHKLR